MLRKLLLSTAIIAVSFNLAIAADQTEVIVDEARFDWSGGYWGAQIGWAMGDHSITEVAPGPGFFMSFNGLGPLGDHDADGVGGGVHAGYRIQNGSLVYGIEGDIGYLHLNEVTGPNANIGNGDDVLVLDGGLYATARVTGGFVVDNVLIYGTIGGALFSADIGLLDIVNPTLNAVESENMLGWVAGGGIEVMTTDGWSWRVEYQRMDFGTTRTSGVFSGQTFNWDNDLVIQTVMLKLSSKF